MPLRKPFALFSTFMLFSLPSFSQQNLTPKGGKRPNVLFIAIDDLRPQLGCYGFPNVKSPNIDKIASQGLLFQNAYCQQALCSPSRTSFLTGLRPDATGIITIGPHFRDSVPHVVTLPQHFKNNGYVTQGFGKVFHEKLDDKVSWSVPHEPGRNPRLSPKGEASIQTNTELNQQNGTKLSLRGFPFEAYEAEDDYFKDGGNTANALKALEKLKDTAFFLAVGFYNPHLPYISPKKYWDLYKASNISLPNNQFPPEGSPEWALRDQSDLDSYHDVPSPLTDDFKRQLIHGYLAATSYVDAQIGRLVHGLEKYGLSDNTLIVILADHGYQLGEHSMWSNKHTHYETSTRSLLIIKSPQAKAKGQQTTSLAHFIDVYPTLVDIAGLPQPSHLQGKSLKEVLDVPSKKINEYAHSQYLRGGYQGYSVTDGRYRLVQWKKEKETVYELYDHASDPDENENVASLPAHKSIVQKLSKQIDQRIENDHNWRKKIGHTHI